MGGGRAVATVSIGVYKTNPMIGGDFRIGVTKEAQGKGYGRLCILYAFSQLAAKGVIFGESAIAFKRKESLYLHYSLGFKPQPSTRFLANKTAQGGFSVDGPYQGASQRFQKPRVIIFCMSE